MDKKILENLKTIVEYLADEDQHFWENCECPDSIKEKEDINLCSCDTNEDHIWRNREELRHYLDKTENEVN